jgi:hypothetical protein
MLKIGSEQLPANASTSKWIIVYKLPGKEKHIYVNESEYVFSPVMQGDER